MRNNKLNKIKLHTIALGIAAGSYLFAPNAHAEEGMWTYDNAPKKQLKAKYNFDLSDKWLEHVRLSSVRFQDGGSGSFISKDGLVITNHHVAVGQIQKLSEEGKDYVTNGYYAKDNSQELRCKDLELNVLIDMENVTDKIRAAAKGKAGKDAITARDNESAKLEQEVKEKLGLKGEIVSLYNGGEYWLYKYKKYEDVRLVFAPERQAAYFGGDYDNFCYPRWDLDITIFRVYEDGKPISSPNYLKWNAKPLAENELVFMSGHPGSTDRLLTMSQLVNMKDVIEPLHLKMIENKIETLREYSKLGAEQERRALIGIFGLENSKKARRGQLEGLKDAALLQKKQSEEDDFRSKINNNPALKQKYGNVFDEISNLVQKGNAIRTKSMFHTLGSNLAYKALALLRYSTEINKPENERLAGYHESDLEGFKFRVTSAAPIYIDMEKANFIGSMKFALANADKNDKFLKIVLNGKTPEARAEELFNNTKLDKADYRKELLANSGKGISNCKEPLMQLAREIDQMLRDEDKEYDELISGKMVELEEKVADARFEVYGKESYPDATFTLRLTYGTTKGYPMNGTIAPYKTTMYGLYDRASSFGNKGDFELSKTYWDAAKGLDLSTTCNFVSTCDIIGGNSGSPTINSKGEFVGIVFDGNIESLPGNFIYDMSKNRAVSCSAEYISYTLKHIYKADRILSEIGQ